MTPRPIACLVGLAAASLALAANPEATERARARECVDWTLELDRLAPEISAAELQERVTKNVARSRRGAGLRRSNEDEKHLQAQRQLEELKDRHGELLRRYQGACDAPTWFVASHLEAACQAAGEPHKGLCGKRPQLAQRGRIKASLAEIQQRGKASPWRHAKVRVQLEPGAGVLPVKAWHSKVVAGNTVGYAILWQVALFRETSPAEFARFLPFVKALQLGPREDRLLLPVVVLSLEHRGPIWDEQQVGAFLAAPGRPPTPLHLRPAFGPGEEFTMAFPVLHPEVWGALRGGGRLLLVTQTRDPLHRFGVPFPAQGFPAAADAFLAGLREKVKELETREEGRASTLGMVTRWLESQNAP